MARRCLRCKKEISQNDFICPHCGLIIGDPVSYATSVKTKQSVKSRFPIRRMIYLLLIVALVASVGVGAWLIRTLLLQQPNLDATGTTATVPQTTQTTAPLTVYTVQLTTESTTNVTGICVHIYSGDQALYSSQVGDNGIATFILPESDGYSVRLTDLPVQYQANYGESSFPFEAGQRDLTLTLEELPVAYTIKIVNSAGDPVPGTGILFYSTDEDEVEQVTDENGICTFITKYNNGSHSCTISFVPNGYVVPNYYNITFPKDRLEFEVEIQTYEEADYDPKDIYTIRVVDEYGEPAPRIRLSVAAMLPDYPGLGISKYGQTNMEGCFSFHCPESLQCKVAILGNIDYADTVFEFEEGQHDMQIQLDLHKEPGDKYTYTVYFRQPDSGVPVYGVQIAVTDDLFSGTAEYYTSDENGMIVFESTRSDPSTVHFYVTSCPDGYDTVRFDLYQISFEQYSRSLTVEMTHDGMVAYKVYLKDMQGVPVTHSTIALSLLNDNETYMVSIDDQGCGTFRLFPTVECEIDWVSLYQLPNGYLNYVVDKIEYGQDRCVYITIAPHASYTYTVKFLDQGTETPVSGVQIAVDIGYGDWEYYTADENGVITFQSTEVDPSLVNFVVSYCPDYYTTASNWPRYNFQSFDRSCTVYLKNDGMVPYTVYLRDSDGLPVDFALLSVCIDGVWQTVEIDDGDTIRHPDDPNYRISGVSLSGLPEEYANYVFDKLEYGEGRCIYITIAPSF